MISRYNVWLNDISLAEIDPTIYIGDIGYQAVSPTRSTSRLAASDGQYSADKDYISANKIIVTFVVREYNTNNRQNVVQNIINWCANGGWLKTSDRIGQRIFVQPSRFPNVVSALRWLDELSIEFTANDYPLWQDECPQKVDIARNGTATFYLQGVRKAFIEADILASAALTSTTVSCGNTQMVLSGINVSAGDTIKIFYTDEHHILSIGVYRNGGIINSLLNKRTANSSDDLIAELGNNSASFTASGNAACTLLVRGVYL